MKVSEVPNLSINGKPVRVKGKPVTQRFINWYEDVEITEQDWNELFDACQKAAKVFNAQGNCNLPTRV